MIEFGQRLNELSSGASGINDSATNETSTLSAKKIIELVNQAKTDAKAKSWAVMLRQSWTLSKN